MNGLPEKIAALQLLHKDNQTSRDQALLALSSATLGFTIAAFDTIYHDKCLWLVILTWFGLATSVISLILSFDTAAKVSEDIIDYEHSSDVENKNKLYKRIKRYNSITVMLNAAALVFYIISLLTFVIFVTVNSLDKEVKMKTHVEGDAVNRGALPANSMMPKQPAAPAAVPQSNSSASQPAITTVTPTNESAK